MNHDAKRATGRGAAGERHAIGVTRMCLRSGSVQLPFALSGRLPEGELLVKDVESDEAVVLWSDPPRRLTGLGALFERHEVQVNDQLILDLQGDDLRLSVAKRPRRSRPKVTPSTWTSHRDPPRPAADDADAHDGGPQERPEGVTPRRRPLDPAGAPTPSETDDVADDRFGAADADGRVRRDDPRHAGIDEAVYDDALDDDAPRAPRVKVKPLPHAQDDAPEPDHGSGPAAHATDEAGGQEGGGPFAGLWRTARGWFSGSPSRRAEADEADTTDEPDWTSAWDADDDVEDVPAAVETFALDEDPARPARPATPRRSRPRFDVRGDDAPGDDVRGDDARGDAVRGDDVRGDQDRIGDVRVSDVRIDDVRIDDVRIDDVPPADERPRPARMPSRRTDRPSERPVADDPPADDVANTDDAASATDVVSEPVEHAPATPAGAQPDPFARRVIGDGFGDEEDDVDDVHDTWSTPVRAPTRPEPRRDVGTAADDERRSDDGPADPRSSAAPEPGAQGETADAEPATTGPVETWTAPDADAGTPTEVETPPRDGDHRDGDHRDGDHRDHARVETGDESTGPTLPSGVPIRAERFLGGDLRTRLLRFLSSPDMPLIAKADMIAKRFDLDPDTAREMLEDVADDPPDGLRLTPVRDGAWRIERTGT